MANEFRLPDIGEGLTEATIVEWLVAVGEAVDRDAPLVELETDKAVTEIPAPVAGTLLARGGEYTDDGGLDAPNHRDGGCSAGRQRARQNGQPRQAALSAHRRAPECWAGGTVRPAGSAE